MKNELANFLNFKTRKMLFFKDPDLGEEIVSGQTPSSSCSTNRVEQNSEGVLENAFLVFEKMLIEVGEFTKKSKNSCFQKIISFLRKSESQKGKGGFVELDLLYKTHPCPRSFGSIFSDI